MGKCERRETSQKSLQAVDQEELQGKGSLCMELAHGSEKERQDSKQID